MAEEIEVQKKSKQNNFVLIIVIIWALILVVSFLSARGEDADRLPVLLDNLTKNTWFGFTGLGASLLGILVSCLIVASWHGLGSLIILLIRKISKGQTKESDSKILNAVKTMVLGAAAWSLFWFFAGLTGSYNSILAVISLLIGLALSIWFTYHNLQTRNVAEGTDSTNIVTKIVFVFVLFIIALTSVSALAPPIAKDTLLYHFSVPETFIAIGKNAVVEGNIASYLALGTEMQVVWAMLFGNLFNVRVAETAASATVFAFFPLLLFVIYGWSRELNTEKLWAILAVLIVATIPTVYHVASSGYIDLALALYITLAIHGIGRWCKTSENEQLFYVTIYLGAALSIKFTALFTVISVGLVILLRARAAQKDEAENPRLHNAFLLKGAISVFCAAVFASPWYIRNWIATGNPVFPFYLNLLNGTAPGWDAERSALLQLVVSRYGGFPKSLIDYLSTPFTISLRAQPELPEYFDGVLGIAFLFGLPLIIWASRRFTLRPEIKIALLISGCLFIFWLFTSQQLRYLLPNFPSLAVAICYSCNLLGQENKLLRQTLAAILIVISIVSGSVTLAWFAQKNPLRVALGGESREEFLTRTLDYYPYYQIVNNELSANSKIWLINMRRDSYHIEKPYFSDYMFEDHTFRQLVEEAKSLAELQTKIRAMGITHILVRHDFLLDYRQSVLVDDKRAEKENLEKLKMAKDLLLGNPSVIRSDKRFSLIKLL